MGLRGEETPPSLYFGGDSVGACVWPIGSFAAPSQTEHEVNCGSRKHREDG